MMFRATVHCETCADDWNVSYRTNKLPPNLPPAGQPFFEKQVRNVALPYYAPTKQVLVAKPKPVVERCASFGYKVAWIAVETMQAARLAKKLLGAGARRAGWREGVDEAYKGAIFVTPSVSGWVFVVSTQFFESVDDPEPLRNRVAPTAQFFASDRVIGLNVGINGKGKRTDVGDEQALMRLAGRWGTNPQTLASLASRGAQGWIASQLA
jgi:hypothetical protein